MKNHTNKYHRRSVRLPGYDYSTTGGYFVTICTKDRQCSLGRFEDGKVVLSPVGKLTQQFWIEIPKHFTNVYLDKFVIMPNHIHGIIIITDNNKTNKINDNYRRGVKFNAPTNENIPTKNSNYFSQISPRKGALSVIIRTYKSAVTHWCRLNGYKNFS